jgi:hypothetical protein
MSITAVQASPTTLLVCGVLPQTIAKILATDEETVRSSLREQVQFPFPATGTPGFEQGVEWTTSELEFIDVVLRLATDFYQAFDKLDSFDLWLNTPHPGRKGNVGTPAEAFQPVHVGELTLEFVYDVLSDAIQIESKEDRNDDDR